jgi:hypothetical protein
VRFRWRRGRQRVLLPLLSVVVRFLLRVLRGICVRKGVRDVGRSVHLSRFNKIIKQHNKNA